MPCRRRAHWPALGCLALSKVSKGLGARPPKAGEGLHALARRRRALGPEQGRPIALPASPAAGGRAGERGLACSWWCSAALRPMAWLHLVPAWTQSPAGHGARGAARRANGVTLRVCWACRPSPPARQLWQAQARPDPLCCAPRAPAQVARARGALLRLPWRVVPGSAPLMRASVPCPGVAYDPRGSPKGGLLGMGCIRLRRAANWTLHARVDAVP